MSQKYGHVSQHVLRRSVANFKRYSHYFRILTVFLSLIIPFTMLYYLDAQSFNATWKGRTFYLFFLWLIVLELMLNWEKPTSKKMKKLRPRIRYVKTIAFVVTLSLPTIYVVAVNFFGLEAAVANLVDLFGIPFAPIQREPWIYWSWGLSLEYLVFTALFAILIWLGYGKDGLKNFSISLLFIGAVGTIYMIDTLYPYGYFTPFQAFVPFTASRAAGVLNWMGYQTSLSAAREPLLVVADSLGTPLVGYRIGWPCAGVQGLLIYTFVILIFLKKTTIPLFHKIIYFVVGALITYTVNILRIVAIYLTYIDTYMNSLSQGVIVARQAASQAARLFHDYYGGLYSMTWIIAYPLIIIGSRMLWAKIKPKLALNDAIRKLFRRSTPMQSS